MKIWPEGGLWHIVFLGNNSYGVQAAAHTYFNSTADKLTIAQAALLAGIVNSTAAVAVPPELHTHRYPPV